MTNFITNTLLIFIEYTVNTFNCDLKIFLISPVLKYFCDSNIHRQSLLRTFVRWYHAHCIPHPSIIFQVDAKRHNINIIKGVRKNKIQNDGNHEKDTQKIYRFQKYSLITTMNIYKLGYHITVCTVCLQKRATLTDLIRKTEKRPTKVGLIIKYYR